MNGSSGGSIAEVADGVAARSAGSPTSYAPVDAARSASRASAGHLRAIEGGSSNSRPTASTCRSGFDTVRYRYRENRDRFLGLGVEMGVAHHARGEVRRSEAGVTVGAFPDGHVYVEGRVAAILYGQDDHRLCSLAELNEAAHLAAGIAGVPAPDLERVAFGRYDQAAELAFEDGREGMALMRLAASADVPWLKTGVEGAKRDDLETVYWRTQRGRSTVLRLYDKGVEAGIAGPGELLRLERQRRFRKSREVSVASLRPEDLRESYVGRELRTLVGIEREHELVTRAGAIESLRSLLAHGTISRRTADALVSFVVLGADELPERTARYRWAQLRRHGIVLDSLRGDGRVVDLAGYVRRFVDQWEVAA